MSAAVSGARGGRSRAVLVAGLAVALAAAGGATAAGAGVFGSRHPAAGVTDAGVIDNGDPTSLATVTRGTLSSQVQVSATLGNSNIVATVV